MKLVEPPGNLLGLGSTQKAAVGTTPCCLWGRRPGLVLQVPRSAGILCRNSRLQAALGVSEFAFGAKEPHLFPRGQAGS